MTCPANSRCSKCTATYLPILSSALTLRANIVTESLTGTLNDLLAAIPLDWHAQSLRLPTKST